METILVLYGTAEEQTSRVSEHIAEVARDHGYGAEARDVKTLPGNLSVERYGGVVVGASIHMGHHEQHVVDFVRENRGLLESLPSAFFSVSITAAETSEEARAQVEGYVEKFVEETGWRPRRVGVFAGALKYTRYGFVKRHLVKSIAKEKRLDYSDTSRDYEYTDWEQVRGFTEEFLEDVIQVHGSAHKLRTKGASR